MNAWRIGLVSAALVVLVGAGVAVSRGADGAAAWKSLFNGKDLQGWKAQGDASWKVEDGCLAGVPADGKGGDLFTTQEWDNCELRFTYKVVWPANSGVWFRGEYQYDILKWKDPVAFSGSLYCSGKMFLTRNLDEGLENRDGWNEGQVYANGDRLILWLNGKKVGECKDDTFKKGPVGLQVHGGDEFRNMKILIKKIEVRPLKADEPPTEPKATQAPKPPKPPEK